MRIVYFTDLAQILGRQVDRSPSTGELFPQPNQWGSHCRWCQSERYMAPTGAIYCPHCDHPHVAVNTDPDGRLEPCMPCHLMLDLNG